MYKLIIIRLHKLKKGNLNLANYATMDLEINGEIIPAEIVQKSFVAALKDVFATII